ncbi:phosphoglycerate dehydrogenase [Amphiplicatus metriothermophilus]|uniref:D-3-phosphoglycerate dehydrogenase n=1 Tax=Amphiplicatus metriothermophilus TaxID=1519374 RepID=A0A239Q0D8_9PROT|nr:phosphoglycerate dehydrogenase [Amphiplicatus metriothermophilus]MBB5520085.1 D-3-phosphoglycerate dehydrogenase [Amphiplicatus metriothermophilus]SNT75890.1 D-3-phosphoglycerate dehydrogenase [Amphiplicatus metriothermophilus]
MAKYKVLVTCPPMLGLIDEFQDAFAARDLECVPAEVRQVKSEAELIASLPQYDGWIMGDDPATRAVVEAGVKGRFKAAIKWGVGVDNVDFAAFKDFGVPVANTPGVFGSEVADVALTYALGLARQTYWIDRQIRENKTWPKPAGISMTCKTVAVIGFGDIGRQIARRILACGSRVIAYDPMYAPIKGLDVECAPWPERVGEADFLIFACPLNDATRGMFDEALLEKLKPGVRVVNVSRGPVIVESALVKGLESGIIHSAALDVFEIEPLPADSPLRAFDKCIFGSHNGSNTVDAVRRVSLLAIEKIADFLHTE